jgi:hypothetical protein
MIEKIWCSYPLESGKKVTREVHPDVCDWHLRENDPICIACQKEKMSKEKDGSPDKPKKEKHQTQSDIFGGEH